MGRKTPALMRCFDILELFPASEGGLTAPAIAEMTGLPRTTVHELLGTMVDRKYLRRDALEGTYHLGITLFSLGNAFAERLDLHAAGLRVAREVASLCDETVNIGILDGPDVIYLCKVDSTQAVRMISRTGGRAPAACTGLGKAMLAFLSKGDYEAIVGSGLPRLTPRSIVDRDELDRQMAETRQRGVAFEVGESTPGVSCVAAPVRDHAGRVIASLSISVPDMRWSQRSPQEWSDLATTGARALSRDFGGL